MYSAYDYVSQSQTRMLWQIILDEEKKPTLVGVGNTVLLRPAGNLSG
jgi:hypothetical protein